MRFEYFTQETAPNIMTLEAKYYATANDIKEEMV